MRITTQQEFFEKGSSLAQNITMKNSKKHRRSQHIGANVPENNLFRQNNLQSLKILLARDFLCSLVPFASGRLRIKREFLAQKFSFLTENADQNFIFFT